MKRVLLGAATVALACTTMIPASAAPAGEKVTGGGQVLVGTSGAGSTIAFTAQESADGTKGQVQYIDRSAGTGRDQVIAHGTVDCVNVITPTEDGGTAKIGGTFEYKDGTTETFVIDVTDGGEGADATDTVVVRLGSASDGGDTDSDGTCEDDDDFANDVQLARGNVQVHKGKG